MFHWLKEAINPLKGSGGNGIIMHEIEIQAVVLVN